MESVASSDYQALILSLIHFTASINFILDLSGGSGNLEVAWKTVPFIQRCYLYPGDPLFPISHQPRTACETCFEGTILPSPFMKTSGVIMVGDADVVELSSSGSGRMEVCVVLVLLGTLVPVRGGM